MRKKLTRRRCDYARSVASKTRPGYRRRGYPTTSPDSAVKGVEATCS
ncbi:hypothetical protein X946_3307 [Burkholderia sp. ABCPW 111]|nr:hypothetical protein X946_3307 [Burkholderia sp. ABCPW 111]